MYNLHGNYQIKYLHILKVKHFAPSADRARLNACNSQANVIIWIFKYQPNCTLCPHYARDFLMNQSQASL